MHFPLALTVSHHHRDHDFMLHLPIAQPTTGRCCVPALAQQAPTSHVLFTPRSETPSSSSGNALTKTYGKQGEIESGEPKGQWRLAKTYQFWDVLECLVLALGLISLHADGNVSSDPPLGQIQRINFPCCVQDSRQQPPCFNC